MALLLPQSGLIRANSSLQIGQTLLQILQGLSLTTNLAVCLDAADLESYAGSGDWLDRSGNARNFTPSGATFNGTPGGGSASEYWAFDGNDQFTSSYAPTFHQNNATFTIVAGWRKPASGAEVILNTQNGSSRDGINVSFSTDLLTLDVAHASGTARTAQTTATGDDSAWNFIGISQNEASATGLIMKLNEATESGKDGTYTTPSSNAATNMRLGRDEAGTFTANGSRLAFLAIWTDAKTSTNLNDLYAALQNQRAYGF